MEGTSVISLCSKCTAAICAAAKPQGLEGTTKESDCKVRHREAVTAGLTQPAGTPQTPGRNAA